MGNVTGGGGGEGQQPGSLKSLYMTVHLAPLSFTLYFLFPLLHLELPIKTLFISFNAVIPDWVTKVCDVSHCVYAMWHIEELLFHDVAE